MGFLELCDDEQGFPLPFGLNQTEQGFGHVVKALAFFLPPSFFREVTG